MVVVPLKNKTEVDPGRVVREIQKIMEAGSVVSLDAPFLDETGRIRCLLDVTPSKEKNVEELVLDGLREEYVKKAVDTLGKDGNPTAIRLKKVLILFFGLSDGVSHTYEEIVPILEVSKRRVGQLKNDAISRLKRSPEAMRLLNFVR